MKNFKPIYLISQTIVKNKTKTLVNQSFCKLYNYSAKSQVPKYNHQGSNPNIVQRYFSNDSKPEKLKLMDFNHLVWPSIFKSIKNWIYANFIIKPYLDPDFTLTKFMEGAKIATEIVSYHLSEGKLNQLEGLVTKECLIEVRNSISLLNAKQRQELSINKGDIYFSFPYELGILFDESKSPQERFVEITVVHHVLKGSREMLDRGDPIPLNIGTEPDFKDKICILNYRFIRNYTKGVSDEWTVNVINHFKPTEYA